MKKIIFILSVLCAPSMSFADVASKYDICEAKGLVASLRSDGDMLHSHDLEEIRDFIKSEDADFIAGISNMSDEDQISLMRSWLAKRTFKFYYDKYMSEIKTQSEKTGRVLKSQTYGSADGLIEQYYWLDRGDLDRPECKQNAVKRRACDYPDGFEEYEILYQNSSSKDESQAIHNLIIDKDDISANSRKVISVTLTISNINHYDSKKLSYSVSVGGTAEKYDEYHKWRNQEVADIRAGKFRKQTRKERKEWKSKYKGSPFESVSVVADDSREWDSNWLPDAAVTDFTIDYDYNYRDNE